MLKRAPFLTSKPHFIYRAFYALCIVFLLQSCVHTLYSYQNYKQLGVDFTKESWVLLQVEVPASAQEKLNATVRENFTALLGNRLTFASENKAYAMQQRLDLHPTPQKLDNWSYGLPATTAINIHAKIARNDLTGASISKYNNNATSNRNEVLVTIEIYDLRTNVILYSQTVQGFSTDEGQTEDFLFVTGTEKMILEAYKKCFKDLKKKSNY